MQWMGSAPASCDICKIEITDEFVDGRTVHGGVWGIMCRGCYKTHGTGLGQGVGQRYMKSASGIFFKMEG